MGPRGEQKGQVAVFNSKKGAKGTPYSHTNKQILWQNTAFNTNEK
jgi:hypothetical protein